MTLLTHAPSPSYGPRSLPKASRDGCAADSLTEQSKPNRIGQICRFALTITLTTVALAGIMALKASIYLAHFNA
jgi:hypothetical protein